MSVDNIQLPRYRSHKEVWALKIAKIEFDIDKARAEGRETDGSAIITPDEPEYAPFRVDAEYVHKHTPKVGGYYVVYGDGYESWSPAPAFEDGYTRLDSTGVPKK
jgi:hypothetical protein